MNNIAIINLHNTVNKLSLRTLRLESRIDNLAFVEKNVFTTLTTTGNLIVGDGTGAKSLNIDGAAGQQRHLAFQSAGLDRWRIITNNEAESGSDAGSNLLIQSREDDGTFLNNTIKIWRDSGDIQIGAGDLYSVPWTDYEDDSSITGWSSFTTKVLEYKRVGNLVFCNYRFSGPGNATSVSFTLPDVAHSASRFVHKPGRTKDNNVWGTGLAYGRTSGSLVVFGKQETSGVSGSWSSGTGTRVLEGSFWYESA